MKSHCFSTEHLEKLLDHQLDAAQEQAVVAHLNDCIDCRRTLAERTADPDFWRQVQAQLRPAFSPLRDSNSSANPVATAGGSVAAASSVAAGRDGTARSAGTADAASSATEPADGLVSKAADHEAAIHFIQQLLLPTDDPTSMGRLGSYEISGIIGVGGMGVVLKGFDPSLHRSVAIKVLAGHLTTSGAARQRFAREARAAASVVHENVMPIHAIDQWQGVPYFVMPLVRGESLEKRLNRSGALDVLEILRIARQIAAGLSAAHQQGLVHRDIKPANVLVEHGSERLMIADFGLARAGDDASLTRPGFILGTPLFMSPEQARGENVDTRCDIFSFGSLLYALATGHAPFRAETPYGVIRRLCEEKPRPIQQYNPTIPFWLSGIIERMMSKRAQDRFADCRELVELFTAGLIYLQQSVESPLPPALAPFVKTHQPKVGSSRNRGLALVAAMVLVVLTALSGAMWYSNSDLNRSPSSLLMTLDQTNQADSANMDQGEAAESASSPTAAADSVVSELPIQSKKFGYRFEPDELLRYSCQLEINSSDQALLVVGKIELQTVEVHEGYAELDYQINWHSFLQPATAGQPSHGDRTIAWQALADSQSSVAEAMTSQELSGPLQRRRHFFGPHINFPTAPAHGSSARWSSDFWSTTPWSTSQLSAANFSDSIDSGARVPFGFEQSEIQNCELAGRVRVGVDGKLHGSSHRSEMPGQLGQVMEWIFPYFGQGQVELGWQASSEIMLTLPQAANLQDWSQRQRVLVARKTDFETAQQDSLENGLLDAQFAITDTPRQPALGDDRSLQSITGNLLFDRSQGKLVNLQAARRSPATDALKPEDSLALREVSLLIERMELP